MALEQLKYSSRTKEMSTVIKLSTVFFQSWPLLANRLQEAVPRGQKDPLSKNLPNRLFRLRESVSVDATNLSRIAGLATGYVIRLEDRVSIPCLDTLEAVAAALGVSPGWLAYGYEGLEPFRERYPRPVVEPADPIPDDSLRTFRALHAGFADRLRQARARSGLSMRALSTAAGVSVQAWSNSESGKVVPRVDTAERMAVALGVAPSWLAFGEGGMN